MWFYLLSAVLGGVIIFLLRKYLSGSNDGKGTRVDHGNHGRDKEPSPIKKPQQEIAKPKPYEQDKFQDKEKENTSPQETNKDKDPEPVFKKPLPVIKGKPDSASSPKIRRVAVDEEPTQAKPTTPKKFDLQPIPPFKGSTDQLETATPSELDSEGAEKQEVVPSSSGRKERPVGRFNLKKLNAEMQKKRQGPGISVSVDSVRENQPSGSVILPSEKKVAAERGNVAGSYIQPPVTGERKKSAPVVVVPKWLQEDNSNNKRKRPELKKSISDSGDITSASPTFEAKRRMVERLQLGVKAPPALVLEEQEVGADERLLKDSQVEVEMAENEAAKLEEEIRRLEEELEEEENEGDDGPEDEGGASNDEEDDEVEGEAVKV